MRRLDYMVFSHVKRIGKLRRTFEEVVKRDLMENTILKALVFNRVG